jgi:MoaA/NifB/PqqE/SkfB family radical SAM enzyme
MNTSFEHIQSIYWVFTQLCNDDCDHCYNDSSPFGKRISESDCMKIIEIYRKE